MSMMMTLTEPFGAMLKRLRTECRFTLRDLGHEASMPHSAIAAIESGRQSITIEVAERLADALRIKDRDSFLMKAVSTTKRERILPFAKEYHAEILNALAIHLTRAGIFPQDIDACYFAKAPFDESAIDGRYVTVIMGQSRTDGRRQVKIVRNQQSADPDLVIQMKSGKRYAVAIKIRAL